MLNFDWSIIGHENILKFLEKNLLNNKFSHAYLFSGPKFIGKTITAKRFVKFLICQQYLEYQANNFKKTATHPCNSCKNCLQFEKGLYPDFYLLEREFDEKKKKFKQNISVEQIRTLQQSIQKHSFANSYKVVLIPEAENLSEGASNSLLKVLEEPTLKTIFILIATTLEDVLPTIKSRCQHLNFMPVSKSQIYDSLLEQGASRDLAQELSAVAVGSPTVAMKFFGNPELYQRYKEDVHVAYNLLSQKTLEQFIYIDKFLKTKEQALEILEKISLLVRDLIMFRLNNEHLISNIFMRDLFAQSPQKNWTQFQLRIQGSRQLIQKNVSPRFVLEELLLND